jgi:hypothetical protein
MAATVSSPEYDYQPSVLRHGSKIYTKIVQQTGGSSVTIPVSGTVESIFEIPIKAISLADTFIRGTLVTTAEAAFLWTFENVHPATELHLMTRSGQYLSSNYRLANYDVLTTPWQTELEDFMSNDAADRFYPSRDTGATANVGGRLTGTPQAVPYTEMKYGQVSASAGTLSIPFTMRLGRYRDTIFALKKTMMFGDVLLLRVVWGPWQKFSVKNASGTDPSAGTPAVPVNTVTVNNLAMFLAVETDSAIVADLVAHTNSGYQMPIPFVNSYVVQGTGTSQSVTVKITGAMGFLLKRIIYAPFNNPERLNTALDHDNRTGTKISSYQTQLDSIVQQQYMVDCSSANGLYEDWNLHRKYCKGSTIQSRDMYQHNWFHLEDYSGMSISETNVCQATKTS